MSINMSACILKYRSILSLVLYLLFSVGSRSYLTSRCVVYRIVAGASSFLILHLSINYSSVIGYYFFFTTLYIKQILLISHLRGTMVQVWERWMSLLSSLPLCMFLFQDFPRLGLQECNVTVNVSIMV